MTAIEAIHTQVAPLLAELAHQLQVSHTWLCRFDFSRHESIVVGEYIQAENSDLGLVYPEFAHEWITWLRQSAGVNVAQVDEMDRNDPNWLEYVEGGAQTVAYFPVKVMGIAWGYLEVWESQEKRAFDKRDELQAMRRTAQSISLILSQLFASNAA